MASTSPPHPQSSTRPASQPVDDSPGRTLRVKIKTDAAASSGDSNSRRNSRTLNVEVLKKRGEHVLVKSTDVSRKVFWMNVAQRTSPTNGLVIVDVDEHPECPEKHQFRAREVQKLQQAVRSASKIDNADIRNGEVQYAGFIVATSRYIAKATVVPNHPGRDPSSSTEDSVPVANLMNILQELQLENVYSGNIVGIERGSHITVEFDLAGEGTLQTGICFVKDMDFQSAEHVRAPPTLPAAVSSPSAIPTPRFPAGRHQKPALHATVHFKILAESRLLNHDRVRDARNSPEREIYLSMKDIQTNRRGNAQFSQHSKEILLERLFSHGRTVVEQYERRNAALRDDGLGDNPPAQFPRMRQREFRANDESFTTASANAIRTVIENITTEETPPDLVDRKKYRCSAEFHCNRTIISHDGRLPVVCRNTWSSVMAWGVYDGADDAYICTCDVLRKRLVGCKHTLKCPDECVVEKRGSMIEAHWDWLPKRDASSVVQKCKNCHEKTEAKSVEVYYNQEGTGRHVPELCPECYRMRTWCSKNAKKEPPKLSEKLGALLALLDPELTWQESDVGMECEFRDRGTRKLYLVQVVPELFFIPDHGRGEGNNPRDGALYTATGKEFQLLRGDRMAGGVDEVQQLKRALRLFSGIRDADNDAPVSGGTIDTASNDGTASAADDFACLRGNMTRRFSCAMRIYRKDIRCTWMGSSRGLYGSYGTRHGEEYFKPGGWIKRAVNRDDYATLEEWPTAYHGTTFETAARIIYAGGLQPPGGRIPVRRGQCGSLSGRSIYVSPAIGFAAHPAYSGLYALVEGQHWVQAVLQLKVRPQSYNKQDNSGRLGGWSRDLRIDPNFANDQGIEWLIEKPEDVVVIGVMFREFGRGVNTDLYEEICAQVIASTADEAGWMWAALLQDHYRAKLYLRDVPVAFDA